MQKSSEIQSQKDHIHYLKSEKAKLSKLKEEQKNLKKSRKSWRQMQPITEAAQKLWTR